MTIDQWLASGRDYAVGCELYQLNGKNLSLKNFFSRRKDGESGMFQMEKLVYELEKLAGLPCIEISVPEISTENQAVISTQEKSGICPPAMQAIIDEKNALFQRGSALHQQLEYLKTDEERYEASKEIEENFQIQLPKLWEIVDKWEATGELPAEVVLPSASSEQNGIAGVNDIPALMRKLTNLRAKISKLKKNPARADDLQAAEKERGEIEELLKSVTL
jgi:hypothetical protein